jgi:hypothetical protein
VKFVECGLSHEACNRRAKKNNTKLFFPHTQTALLLHLYIIKVIYSPTDAQVNCLKNNFKIYIKIEVKTAPTCFGAVTPSSGSGLFELAKVTVVKIATLVTVTLATTSNVFPDDGDCTETCRSCFNFNFNVNFKIVFKIIHLCISWLVRKL